MTEQQLSAADVAYVRRNYRTLEAICADREETPTDVRQLIARGLLAQPSYVLEDGTEMFPADHFRVPDEAGGPTHSLRNAPRGSRRATSAA